MKLPDGMEVWRLPEFQALLKVLNINLPDTTDLKSVTIRVAAAEVTIVTFEMLTKLENKQ